MFITEVQTETLPAETANTVWTRGNRLHVAKDLHREFTTIPTACVAVAVFTDRDGDTHYAVGADTDNDDNQPVYFADGYDAWEAAVALANTLAGDDPWDVAYDNRVIAATLHCAGGVEAIESASHHDEVDLAA